MFTAINLNWKTARSSLKRLKFVDKGTTGLYLWTSWLEVHNSHVHISTFAHTADHKQHHFYHRHSITDRSILDKDTAKPLRDTDEANYLIRECILASNIQDWYFSNGLYSLECKCYHSTANTSSRRENLDSLFLCLEYGKKVGWFFNMKCERVSKIFYHHSVAHINLCNGDAYYCCIL